MNYIKELNAFYDWLEINELSPSAINLWYALMHINNKAAWAETFTVAESVLCVKTGLTDRTLRKVRNELKQKNRIDFISRKGGRAPIYRVISFYSTENNSADSSEENKPTEINSADSAGVSAEGSSVGSAGDSSALNKRKETKPNETNTATATKRSNYFDEYMICFSGQPSPIQIQEINSFIDKDGLQEEVICLAFRKASENGAKYPYARSILNSWSKKGIRTAEDVQKEQEQFEANRQQQASQRKGFAPIRKEKIPEYWDSENSHEEQQMDSDELEKRRVALQERIRALK
ncbi:DnaD domain-containing protein [Niallia circulans]|uniref:DnaD domain-containing protein n=1 Tax=Niallia circulans TaxID=1397 RepID=UPI003526887D